MANSADPDQLASSTDLDLHCLQRQDISGLSAGQGLKNAICIGALMKAAITIHSCSGNSLLFKHFRLSGAFSVFCSSVLYSFHHTGSILPRDPFLLEYAKHTRLSHRMTKH